MRLLGEIAICFITGLTAGWFFHAEYVKKCKSEWKQVNGKQVKQKAEKPIRIVIQKNGVWYSITEKDILNNQK